MLNFLGIGSFKVQYFQSNPIQVKTCTINIVGTWIVLETIYSIKTWYILKVEKLAINESNALLKAHKES